MNVTTHTKPLNDSQYRALSGLFNECNSDFWLISEATRSAFFDRLYANGDEVNKIKVIKVIKVRAVKPTKSASDTIDNSGA
jgi:hypothetical protein